MRAASRRRSLAAVLAVGLLAVPTGAFGAPDATSLADARDQLTTAGRDLARLEATIRGIGDEVAAADERLQAATTSLATVRARLTEAAAAADAAGAAERSAASALEAATTALADHGERHRDGRDLLAEQAVSTYKRGGVPAGGVLVGGLVRAGDLHELAVTREALGRVLADRREAFDRDVALTRATASASADLGDARRAAVRTAREAAEERRRVETLVADQERLLATVERTAADRRETLARLEQDAAARALLVRDLEARVAELEVASTTVRVPVDLDLDLDGPPPAWTAGLPPAGRPWAATIAAVAAREGLDGRLLAALVWTESGFRPDAVSHAGAYGMAQLMPGTARGLGVDPRDPVQNLAGGARYLARQLDEFGSIDLALAAYNAGPGRVVSAGRQIPDIVETQLYVVRVLDRYRALTTLGG